MMLTQCYTIPYIHTYIHTYIHLQLVESKCSKKKYIADLNEVLSFLNGSRVLGQLGGLEFDGAGGRVEADLQLQILHHGRHDVVPLVAQRRQAVRWAAHFAILHGATLKEGSNHRLQIAEMYLCMYT